MARLVCVPNSCTAELYDTCGHEVAEIIMMGEVRPSGEFMKAKLTKIQEAMRFATIEIDPKRPADE